MKKILFIMTAIAALAFTSCNEGKKHEGLAGTTWVYKLEVSTSMWMDMTLVFKDDSTVDFTEGEMYDGEYYSETITGTYTYVASTVVLTFYDDEDDSSLRMSGKIIDNKLLLYVDDPTAGGLTFIKK